MLHIKKSKKFFVIKLMGGIGNQMFQYAFIKSMSLKHNCDFYFDLSGLDNSGTKRRFELNVFNLIDKKYFLPINYKISNTFFKKQITRIFKFLNIPRYHEESLEFNSRLLELKPPLMLIGYFQSPKYFGWCWEELYQTFQFPKESLGSYHLKILEKIELTNSVSVHFRRGDYVTNPKTEKFHGNLSFDYYHAALSEITAMENNFKLFIFSDDINWVEQNVEFGHDSIYVNSNNNAQNWIDMYLMSCCQYNIIANSSYSWWAGFLNKRPGSLVFYPEKWYAELAINPCFGISDRWIKIATNNV